MTNKPIAKPIPPYGTADWAQHADIHQAGMYRKDKNSVFLGFFNRRRLNYSGQGGLVSCGSARSGKLSTQLAYNLCGKDAYENSCLVLDPKGELAAVSQNQMFLRKACHYWNPLRMHGLPCSKINILDHIYRGSPTVVSDTKAFYDQWHPSAEFASTRFFEISAKDIAEAITVGLTDINGSVDIAQVYNMVNLIETGEREWLIFEYKMSQSKNVFIRRIAAEIRNHNKAKNQSSSSGGGMAGVLKELYNGFSCLNDSVLRESVSPPFSFSFAQICEKNAPASNFYMMPRDDLIGVWSPVIKAMFENAKIHHSRRPDARPQTWFIDECGQLATNGKFPLITSLFTIQAGKNIRPWIFIQSLAQLNKIDDDGQELILSSAGVKCYFAIQNYETASYLSAQLGVQQIEIPDPLQQQQSKLDLRKVGNQILQGDYDGDVLREYVLHKRASVHLNKMARDLMQPNEIMNDLSGQMIIAHADMGNPIKADRVPYYKSKSMDGAFHPNPYWPPVDRVQMAGGIARVIRQAVPKRYAHFPQYASSGEWSFIAGYRP